MRKHSVSSFINDVACIFSLRVRLMVKDMTTLVALVSAVVIFSFVILSLTVSSTEQSAIPVGFVDYDKSTESVELVSRLSQVPALRIVEQSERELNKLLLDEMINAIFVIEEGYEKKLRSGNPDGLISMYFVGDNKSASIISDIVAGEMIFPISLYKSIRLYQGISYEGSKHSVPMYKDYVASLLNNSPDFDFAFQMIYENPGGKLAGEEPITNSLLYNQLIFGILGILVAFIAMFLISGVVRDKEMCLDQRLKISRFHPIKMDIGNILSVVFMEGIIALILSFLIYRQMASLKVGIFISSYLLILLYAIVMAGIFILIAKLVKSIITYQMLCSILILVTGGLGFYYLLTGFYQFISGELLNIIPNSWFIQGFTDIMVFGDNEGILNQGHVMLIILAAVIGLLITASDFISLHKTLSKNKSL